MTPTPNHALQRTPGFGVQLPGSAAVVRPAQSRAVRPAMKPGTARAFALPRCASMRAPGPESLSLGSLGVATRLVKSAFIFLTIFACVLRVGAAAQSSSEPLSLRRHDAVITAFDT